MDEITVIIPTSILPSHPSLEIIETTINSIRHHLPNSDIILQIDGLRDEQKNEKTRYDEYKTKLLWNCLHKYKNVLPVVFEKYSHQSTMLKETINLVKTSLILYIEGDTPLVIDLKIDWKKCINFINIGEANTIRFHFEAVIPKEHDNLMLGLKDGFMKTVQWSQRPHLSTKLYYKEVVLPTLKKDYFIEDTFHGVVMNDWYDHGRIGWNKHRLWIYYPNEDNIKRSYHLDGRAGGLKYTTDDEVGL